MKRPLPRLEAVEMTGIEREQRTPILKREAQVARHVVRAEPVKIALDQADALKSLSTTVM